VTSLLDIMEQLYPSQPGWKGMETSRAAADDVAPKAPRLREMVLVALRDKPRTADECADHLGIDKLSIRPRCSELSALGKIVDTGDRRLNASGKRAVVWGAAQ
jgi:predicted ArsR family transcriptional regulator